MDQNDAEIFTVYQYKIKKEILCTVHLSDIMKLSTFLSGKFENSKNMHAK